MSDTTSPAVERRRLARELRSLRTGANRTIYEVASLLECSPGKISRIENGIVGAQLRDVRELLDIYDVHGERREELLDLVRGARRRAWWHDFTDVVPPASARFYGLEAGAATIDSYSGTALLPGLLQTVAYAHALIDASNAPYQVVARRLELRTKRKQLLTNPEAPQACFVISESALVAKVGGHQVLGDQLRHLTEIAALPNVTIHVMRLDTDAHAAMGTSFTSFGFADDADPQIVYLEQLTGNTYIENSDDVAVYTAAFIEATKLAIGPDDSRRLIAQRSGSVW